MNIVIESQLLKSNTGDDSSDNLGFYCALYDLNPCKSLNEVKTEYKNKYNEEVSFECIVSFKTLAGYIIRTSREYQQNVNFWDVPTDPDKRLNLLLSLSEVPISLKKSFVLLHELYHTKANYMLFSKINNSKKGGQQDGIDLFLKNNFKDKNQDGNLKQFVEHHKLQDLFKDGEIKLSCLKRFSLDKNKINIPSKQGDIEKCNINELYGEIEKVINNYISFICDRAKRLENRKIYSGVICLDGGTIK